MEVAEGSRPARAGHRVDVDPADLLVTLGSPLALPGAVFGRLQPRPALAVGLRPANVRRWVNISDNGDPIAIFRPLQNLLPRRQPGPHRKRRAVRTSTALPRYLACASLAATLQQSWHHPAASGRGRARAATRELASVRHGCLICGITAGKATMKSAVKELWFFRRSSG